MRFTRRAPNYTPTPSPYALHCVQNLSHTPFPRTRQRCSPVHHAGTDSQWYRHLLLSSFLRLSCMRSRGVLLLDLKDVLVQGPPWPLLAPGRVTVFEEIGQIRHAPWNQCAHTPHATPIPYTHTSRAPHCRAPTAANTGRLPRPLPCDGVCVAPLPRCKHQLEARARPPLSHVALTPGAVCAGASSRSSRGARGRRWRLCSEARRR